MRNPMSRANPKDKSKESKRKRGEADQPQITATTTSAASGGSGPRQQPLTFPALQPNTSSVALRVHELRTPAAQRKKRRTGDGDGNPKK